MENDIQQQQKHFDSIADKYFKARQSKNSVLLKNLMWTYFFKDKQFLREKIHAVLEPMCGYAEGKDIVENHLTRSFKYEGFDFSQNIVDFAKKNHPESIIKVMNVLDMNIKKKHDLVIIIGGLHHVFRHTPVIVKKIYDSLKPGGYFICYEPTSNNILMQKIREMIYKKNPLFDDETERAFNLKDLNKHFTGGGFSIADQVYPGLLSYILYYNPDAFPFLNFGNGTLVKTCFNLDKLFLRNWLGKKFSFATLTLLQKNHDN